MAILAFQNIGMLGLSFVILIGACKSNNISSANKGFEAQICSVEAFEYLSRISAEQSPEALAVIRKQPVNISHNISLLTAILDSSNGKLSTAEVYSYTASKGKGAIGRLDKSVRQYVPDRLDLHRIIVDQALNEIRKASKTLRLNNNFTKDPFVVVLRGNSAAGKTRALTTSGISYLSKSYETNSKLTYRTINPDIFKAELNAKTNTKFPLLNDQVHQEGAAIADVVMHAAFKEKGLSYIIDRRFLYPQNIDEVAQKAVAKQIHVLDVDAPLEMSVVGVLLRSPRGGDAVMGFDVIGVGGFVPARRHRLEVIEYLQKNLGSRAYYQLVGTSPSGEKYLVAEMKAGKLDIFDAEGFHEMTSDPIQQVERIKNTVIDDEVVVRFSNFYNYQPGSAKMIAEKISAFKGRTIGQAMEIHRQANLK